MTAMQVCKQHGDTGSSSVWSLRRWTCFSVCTLNRIEMCSWFLSHKQGMKSVKTPFRTQVKYVQRRFLLSNSNVFYLKKKIHWMFSFTSDLERLQLPTMEGLAKKLVCHGIFFLTWIKMQK
jgi:hypothetical protein